MASRKSENGANSNPAVTLLDCRSIAREPAEPADSTFWTGREGQMCVQYFRPKSDVFYAPHVHSEYTLVVCLAGEVMVKQMGQEQTIGTGEALFGNDGVPHASGYRTQNGRPCEAVSISVDRRLLASLTADFEMLPWRKSASPAFIGKIHGPGLRDSAQAIARELKSTHQGKTVLLEVHAIQLLIESMRLWPRSGVAEVGVNAAQRLPRREFIRAYEFMRWCRKEDFRLRLLCQYLGSSEERFARLFLASTDQTPANFYNRMLMDRACLLLTQASLSVKEIAFELGFRNSSHFTAAFSRMHAVSPQKYRETCGGRVSVVV